jgi:hypothetical protein
MKENKMNLMCWLLGHKFKVHTHFPLCSDLYCERCGKIVKLSRDLTNREDDELKK